MPQERLRLLVTDNGTHAFGATPEARVIGAMRARARALGGRLEFGSGPNGHGGALLLDVPRVPERPLR